MKASIDFETYSEAGYVLECGKVRGAGARGKGGLPLVGTPCYAEHESADIICLAYDMHDGAGVRLWAPGMSDPADLLDHVRNGGEVAGWNITFELYLWNYVCTRRYGWPPLTIEQSHCDMARSRRYSLPGSLANAAKVVGGEQKDGEGKRLITKLTRPHTWSKKRQSYRWLPSDAWEDFAAMYQYCAQDVVTEDSVADCTPPLTPDERAVWVVDQHINARGVQVDVAALSASLDILEQAEGHFTAELCTITHGAVTSVNEVAKLAAFCGLHDVTADTVRDTLTRDDLSRPVRRALEIRRTLGSANIKKLRTLHHQINRDGRLRNQYAYCGADRTGRWSAGGVQLQNLTAKGPKAQECEGCGRIFGAHREACPDCGSWLVHTVSDWDVGCVRYALRDIERRDLQHIIDIWGADPLAVLCGCLRGLFIAQPGYDLICADFSAIEAVVAACLARCQWRVDVFGTHGKIYEQSAANATGIPFDEILEYKRVNGVSHPARKTIGKVRELAGGYGGWIGAWKNFGADAFMTDDEIKADVLKWRDESPEIVDMWGGQYRWCGPGKWDYRPELYGLEGAAISAILQPGQWFSHIDVGYCVVGDVLHCRLPSGRDLHYHRPRLQSVPDRLNRGDCLQITFEGYNSNPTKGPVGWQRMDTYGGRLFENVVQAVARDIQAAAMVRAAGAGYNIVMHTHDEVCCEVPTGRGSLDELVQIMTERPAWASWWPIRADGWRDDRYQK